MKEHFVGVACVISLAAGALAGPQQFDFKDSKGVNNAIFRLDAPLEAINGSANGISGTVTFDPANPMATRGKIVIAASSLHVGNATMKEHMHGEKWLDVSKYPEISFETKELKNVKTSGDTTTADAAGTFTLRGKSRDMTIPVKLTYLKDKLSQRQRQEGDLLVIRSNFTIKRADFGLNAGQMEDKVADAIELTLSIAGASPR